MTTTAEPAHTAPKDGTEFLIRPYGDWQVVQWSNYYGKFIISNDEHGHYFNVDCFDWWVPLPNPDDIEVA